MGQPEVFEDPDYLQSLEEIDPNWEDIDLADLQEVPVSDLQEVESGN